MAVVSESPWKVPSPLPGPVYFRRDRDGGVVFSGIRWQTYLALLQDFADRPVRLTYDRGNLEIMAPSFRHETYAKFLGRFVETLGEELEIDFKSGRTTTFRRQELERGLEADDCFYFENLPAILGKEEIDLSRDPPPDLALEIDISTSSLDRMSIYAALRVPQIWRFDGQALHVFCLAPGGEYQQCERSPTFPDVPLETLVDFLRQTTELDDRNLLRLFREWVRNEVLPRYKKGGQPSPGQPKTE